MRSVLRRPINSKSALSTGLPRYLKLIYLLVLIGFPFLVKILGYRSDYILRIITLVGVYVILALGLSLILGYTGQLSMGHAAFFGIGAYTSALLSLHFGWSFWFTLPIAGLVGCIFGFLLGLPTLRVKEDYLAIVTLAFGELVRLTMLNWIGLTRGPMGLPNIPPPSLFGIMLSSVPQFYICLGLVFLTVFSIHRLVNSAFGREMIAIREDEIAADAMGINVTRVKVIVFALAGLYAGLAGSFFAHFNGYISPDNFTYSESVGILLMIVLGGIDSIPGVILGASVLTLLPEALRGIGAWRMVIYGLLMVVMILVRPQGLLGHKVVKMQNPINNELSLQKTQMREDVVDDKHTD